MAIGASLALALSTWALYRLVNARTFQLLIIQGLHQRGYRMATLNEMRRGACAG